MEPLYPQNILERRFPILREQREKAERESDLEPKEESNSRWADEDELEEGLYVEIPYAGGSTGEFLNTLA